MGLLPLLLWMNLPGGPIGCADAPEASTQQAPATLEEWLVGPDPVLVLGGDTAPEAQRFGRVSAADLTPEGALVVGDGARGEVRVFGSDGSLDRILGRRGEGPGEFSDISALSVDPATRKLEVLDPALQRLTTVDLTDGSVASLQLQAPRPISGFGRLIGPRPLMFGRTRDRLLATPPGRVARDTIAIYALELDGSVSDTLFRLPGGIVAGFMVEGVATQRHILFSPFPSVAAVGTCIVVAQGDSASLVLVDQAGDFVDRLPLRTEPRPATEAHRDRWIAEFVADLSEAEARYVRSLARRLPMADFIPVVWDIVVDDVGFVWVQLASELASGSSRVVVLDDQGRTSAHVTLPDPGRILAIRRDLVVLSGRNASGAAVVRVFPLLRGDRGSQPRPIRSECRGP